MSRKHKKRYYTVGRARCETFAKATEYAVGVTIETGEDINITVRAQAEEVS
jgi:hypothetical protein